jgi:CrcB protein
MSRAGARRAGPKGAYAGGPAAVPMMTYVWVALGSAIGGAGRFWMSGLVAARVGETFPWGTIAVNVAGSFAIGLFAALTGPDGRLLMGAEARQFFMLGVCGGFTTFSSFSLQTLNLVRGGEWGWAAANIALSVVLCLAAVLAGAMAGQALNRPGGL